MPRNTGQGGRLRAPAATVSEDETVSLQVSAQPSTGILGRQCPDPPCTPGQVQRSHVATRRAPRTLGELGTRQLTHCMWGPSPPRTPHPAQTCTSPPGRQRKEVPWSCPALPPGRGEPAPLRGAGCLPRRGVGAAGLGGRTGSGLQTRPRGNRGGPDRSHQLLAFQPPKSSNLPRQPGGGGPAF